MPACCLPQPAACHTLDGTRQGQRDTQTREQVNRELVTHIHRLQLVLCVSPQLGRDHCQLTGWALVVLRRTSAPKPGDEGRQRRTSSKPFVPRSLRLLQLPSPPQHKLMYSCCSRAAHRSTLNPALLLVVCRLPLTASCWPQRPSPAAQPAFSPMQVSWLVPQTTKPQRGPPRCYAPSTPAARLFPLAASGDPACRSLLAAASLTCPL